MSTFKALEDYVLSGNISEALKALIPGSDEFNYVTYLHSLSQGSLDLSAKITEFVNKYPSTPEKKKLELRLLLLQYDRAKNEEKPKIIGQIKKIFGLELNDIKPADIKSSKLSDIAKEKKEKSENLEKIVMEEELKMLYKKALNVSEFPFSVLCNVDFMQLDDQ